MTRPLLALVLAFAAVAAVAAVVVAADRERARDRPQDRADILELLGLTFGELEALRHDEGLSLAQIARRQGVDPELLVDRLVAEWTERIRIREARRALSPEEAERLREQLEVRVRDIVDRPGGLGMAGSAIGSGRGFGGAGSGPWHVGSRAEQDADRAPGPAGSRGRGHGGGADDQAGAEASGGGRRARDGTGPLGPGRP